jgi:protein MpaA
MFTIGNGPERVLIMATIHGDEPAGLPLSSRLIKRLKLFTHLHDRYTVMIIPLANPDGFALGTRFNASGVDLNRNFPASNRINSTTFGLDSLTEPEARVLHDLILSRKPTRIVSIHQPLYCLDYDGPGEGLAEAMALYCPLPVKKLGSRAGSFGSFCGMELNIPIITMELAKEDSDLTEDQLWSLYGFSLLAAITYPELPF